MAFTTTKIAGSSGNASPLGTSATFSPPNAGDLLWCLGSTGNNDGTQQITGVTDSAGGTWTPISDGAGSQHDAAWWFKISDGTETYVEVSYSTSTGNDMMVFKSTGWTGTPTLEGWSEHEGNLETADNDGSFPLYSSAISNTTASALILGWAVSDGLGTITDGGRAVSDGNAYTEVGDQGSQIYAFVREVSSTGSYSPVYTYSDSNDQLYAACAVFGDDAGGGSIESGAGSSAGAATADAVGASTAAVAGAAAGSATAPGVGASTAVATGTSAGQASADAEGASTAEAAGNSDGTSTATAEGDTTGSGIESGAGSAAGTSTADGVGASTAATVGGAAGSASADAEGAATAEAVGTSTGTSTADGVGDTAGATIESGAGSAAGSATVSGVGASTAESAGSSAGQATASGVGADATLAPQAVAKNGGGPDEEDDAEKHFAERRKFIERQVKKPVPAAVTKAAATHTQPAPSAAPAQPQKAGEVARATDAQAPARTRPTAAPRPAPQPEALAELVAAVDAATEVHAKRQARQRRQKRLKALLLLAAAA